MRLKLILGHVGRDYAHALLLVIFVECRNDVPDLQLIIDWVKTRLWLVLTLQEAAILVKYVTLFRPLPSEVISEFDAFQRANSQDPLLFFSQVVLGKEEWCQKTEKFFSDRKNEVYWDQARLVERKPIGGGRMSKLLRMASSSFINKAKVVPGDEGYGRAENSVELRKVQQLNRSVSFSGSNGKYDLPASPTHRGISDPNIRISVGVDRTHDHGNRDPRNGKDQLSCSPVEPFKDSGAQQTHITSNFLVDLAADASVEDFN